MKKTSILNQLVLNQTSKIAAITTALFFVIQPTSVKAELKIPAKEKLIALEAIDQDTGATVNLGTSETNYTLGAGDVIRLD
ncbi:MAG TPA: sugar ABC transporter substrate-binding protein, partial [Xenococcaceae cyanobacterium]